MVTYLAVYTESKNDSPAFSIWDTYQQALNAKVPEGMILWDIMAVKDDATFGSEGVAYTGDYQTNDNYNPYKYVNEAPFGAEDDPTDYAYEPTDAEDEICIERYCDSPVEHNVRRMVGSGGFGPRLIYRGLCSKCLPLWLDAGWREEKMDAESFSAERKKKKSGCLHFKYGKHCWAYSGNGAICVDCGLTTYIDEDGKKSYGTRSIPFKGNYDAHQAESFSAEYGPSVEGMIENPANYHSYWQSFCEYMEVRDAHTAWRMVEKPWKWRRELEQWVNDPEWFTQQAETLKADYEDDDSLSELAQQEIKSLRQIIQHLEETGPPIDIGTELNPLGTASETSIYQWEQKLKSAKQRLYHLLDQQKIPEGEMCPDFAVDQNHCFLKKCKVCAKEGRTPEVLQELLKTGWFTRGPDGRVYQKDILDSDFGIQSHSRRPTMLPRKDDYNLGEYNAEEYPFEEVRKINYARLDAQKEQDPWAWYKEDTLVRLEPMEDLNMKGVGGMLLVVLGILLWQA